MERIKGKEGAWPKCRRPGPVGGNNGDDQEEKECWRARLARRCDFGRES